MRRILIQNQPMPISLNISDPIDFQCDCLKQPKTVNGEKSIMLPANQTGKVLLFYNYIQIQEPNKLAVFLQELCSKLEIRGKIRLASEGFNITLGGSFESMVEFVSVLLKKDLALASSGGEQNCIFRGIGQLIKIDLNDDQDLFQDIYEAFQCTSAKRAEVLSPFGQFVYFFFKPSEGCQHVFEKLSVSVLQDGRLFGGIRSDLLCIPCTSEQLGDIIYQKTMSNEPANQKIEKKDKVVSLLPAEFHSQLLNQVENEDIILLDCRNYYEMKIGHFKDAILPPVRKYSLLPKYLEKNKDMFKGKKVFTYCTGGVRCETAAPLISLQTEASQVIMLQGGIHNYLDYVSSYNLDSLFTGVNYVFDARQSLGSPSSFCSFCVQCDKVCVEYIKCQCHSIIICCQDCIQLCKYNGNQIYCCDDCAKGKRPCFCERNRGKELGILN